MIEKIEAGVIIRTTHEGEPCHTFDYSGRISWRRRRLKLAGRRSMGDAASDNKSCFKSESHESRLSKSSAVISDQFGSAGSQFLIFYCCFKSKTDLRLRGLDKEGGRWQCSG